MIGSRLEHYEITSHLGSGGMGEVYQATDSRLGRSVAIKILPDEFSRDSDRVARFEREARLLASLNHPRIAAIYGLGHSADRAFLVMELVPGETLAQHIARYGARPGLPLPEAVSIARQIAEALQAAHQAGIIHRDLKPANIRLTPDGEVKVLDFGLAKATGPGETGADLSQSPTITNAEMTRAGVILGTAAYMSPEQAKGHTLDRRSDIWSFGCILFEMLTGSRVFEAQDVPDTLAAVLTRDPDSSKLPAGLPRQIHRLLRSCLDRDRARRMTDIAGALFALDGVLDDATASTPPPAVRPRTLFAAAGWVAALVFGVTALVALYLLHGSTSALPTMVLRTETPPGDPFAFALSPDGTSMVFNATVDGRNRLWLRRFESGEDRPLSGTEGGYFPFWSPNGLSVAFFANTTLKRIDLSTAYVRTVAEVPGDPRPGTWNEAGTILFGAATSPLFKVSAEGGSPVQEATALLPGQSSHRFSQFLPDGNRFLFLALGESNIKGVYLGSLDDKTITRVTDGEPPFSFLPPDHLILAREGALWALTLDMKSGKPQGGLQRLQPIAPKVYVDAQMNGLAALSASASGSLAYRASPATRRLVWVDRSGRETGALSDADDSQPEITALSKDVAAVRRTVNGNTDVWSVDTTRGTRRRMTLAPAIDGGAAFSPDGSRIAYSSDPKGTLWDIYERRTDGTGGEKLLVANPGNDYVLDWSPDGRYLLYGSDSPKMDGDIFALPLFGEGKAFPVAQTPAYEFDGRFSPDGRWILFKSNESGRTEIHAQPFPGPGERIQITVGGVGGLLCFPRGGRELIYEATGGKVTAVTLTERGATLVADTPRTLFPLLDGDGLMPTPDGRQFLVSRSVSRPPSITFILNWKPPR